jgi:hypothetical protein
VRTLAKKKKVAQASGESGGKGTKELKIITVQVVTKDKVLENPRQMALLYIIDKFGPLHERTLHHLVKDIQDLGFDLGYKFNVIGGTPYSQELKSDLVALLYVGFAETEPSMYRKLRVTSEGKGALEKKAPPQGLADIIEKNFERLRNKASLLDGQLDHEIRMRLRELSRRRSSFRL